MNSANIKEWQQQIARYGSEQAFSELFRHFYDRLLRFSLQYVQSREAAEEIVSDVFVKIWNRREALEAVNNLEVYLFIAVRNRSLNYLEQYSALRITPLTDNGIAQLTNPIDPERTMEWKEVLFKMDQEVDRLPDQCRKVFKLIKEEGFKYKEVAAILNISPRTVETQLFRAMRRLNEAIGPYLQELMMKR
ncbi:RNA polymerase sigma-70 factor [Chitinophaga japonensis]|uniref:RNA polymerase sigma-70 factor (ECF subfamily) n=1 Tax=Chitinophaga japonensis TaxID=104662 RepID=A0A562T871_CHIJA|nr:RNA polymerase sigma-70 factor [Chitinophaga japonensis]TWI89166.1 RNA polymerase sigma-70 factor (ECF subfamily) [Chitinophaga japonensis]